MPLTDTAIRAAKPKAKPYKLADANSLYPLVTPTGAKCWRYDYRFSGKRKSLSIGTYPDMTLAGARRERDIARDMIVAGEDPCHQRKLGHVEGNGVLIECGVRIASAQMGVDLLGMRRLIRKPKTVSALTELGRIAIR